MVALQNYPDGEVQSDGMILGMDSKDLESGNCTVLNWSSTLCMDYVKPGIGDQFSNHGVKQFTKLLSDFSKSEGHCIGVVNNNWKDSPRTVLDIYRELIQSGLRIWVFSGDNDAVIPITSTRYSIDSLKLPTVSPWRAWYDDGQVGGWTQEYAGLTFVSVRGAGHEVPLHKPKLALSLVKSFLAGASMPDLKQISDS